jgi:chromosome segregation ATPase
LTIKLTGVAVLILLALFTSLFLSMDSQQGLLNEVSQYRTHIQGQQEILLRADAEKKRINKELDMIGEGDLSRRERTKMIDLNLQIHEINEQIISAQTEINAYQRRMDELEKKIDEMNKKPFLRRLFRL